MQVQFQFHAEAPPTRSQDNYITSICSIQRSEQSCAVKARCEPVGWMQTIPCCLHWEPMGAWGCLLHRKGDETMKQVQLPIPELGLIAATRGMLGAGAAL